MTAQPRRAALDAVKARIRALETGVGGRVENRATVGLGDKALDRGLPWGGLPRAALHEIRGDAAAAGFTAALAARLAGSDGTVLWCQSRAEAHEAGRLHGPGLGAFGLDSRRLVVVTAGPGAEVLWVLEEGFRSAGIAVVVAEGGAPDLTASRRLQLAAEAGGATGLVLTPGEAPAGPSAALTRWRVAPAPSAAVTLSPGLMGPARWDVALWRCRGGGPGHWIVDWDATALRFRLVAALADRPASPGDVRRSA